MTPANVHFLIWMAALAVIIIAIAVSFAYAATHNGTDDCEEDDS